MTQPVFEPTDQRHFGNLSWGERQLRRRPAPQGTPTVPVEWITWDSSDTWAASANDLTFAFLNGDYDTTTPTFDLSAGSPRICRGGVYSHHITVINITATPGVQTVVRMDLTRIAGAIPFFHNYNPDVQLVRDIGGTGDAQLITPWWQGFILYPGAGQALFGTPTTLQVEASAYDDGAIVAETPYVALTIVRLGDAYS